MKEQVTTTIHWTGDWAWYVGVGGAVFLALVAFVLYRRDTRQGCIGLALPILRALAIFLIVVLLSGPVLHHRKVIGELARLIVCLDASDSMQLTDASMEASRKIAIARRLGLIDETTTAMDLPHAAERLADARALTASFGAVDAAAAGDAVTGAVQEFGRLVREADELFKNSGAEKEGYGRFQKELFEPAQNLAKREIQSGDDRTRAAGDLTRLGEMAGRWSRELSETFQRQIDNDPAAAALKSALSKVDAMPRWQRVQALLLEGKPEQRILEQLAKTHDVQVVLLQNAQVKQFWQPGGENPGLPPVLPKPEGEITNLTSGLKFAGGDQNRAEKGAVVVFSDGQHNAGEAPIEAARILAGRKMPIYAIGVGSQVPPRDISVVRTVVPDSVFHEDRVRGEVIVKEEVPAGQTFTVAIKDGEKTIWEKQLLTEGRPLRRIPFDISVKEIAEARLQQGASSRGYEVLGAAVDLRVVVSGLEGDREASNNEGAARFRAVTQKRKILIVDGRPRWETRYLRNLFERDEKWEVNAVMAGATTDAGLIRGDKPGTFPNDSKLLDAYDLVIFGEVPKTALKEEELKWLADFVAKRGGAMLFIDGPRGVLRQYADTPLAPLFPVEWPAGGTGLRGKVNALALTDRAATQAAFALTAEPAGNQDAWSKLPAPHWLSGAQALPGAEVLIEADTGGGKVPASVLRSFGAGRVYYQAFDDSWRWRYEVADLHHVKFWNQLASFVAEAPFAARDQYVQVDAGRLTYQPGESADLRVRLRDNTGKPVTDAAVSAVLYRDEVRVATIPLSPDEGGLYRGKSGALEPGNYEMAVESAVVPEGQLKARTQFKVTARESMERTILSLNEDLLRQISIAGGGEYFREEKADEVLARLAPLSAGNVIETDTRLLENKWWFMAVVLLLTVEWVIRKRAGML